MVAFVGGSGNFGIDLFYPALRYQQMIVFTNPGINYIHLAVIKIWIIVFFPQLLKPHNTAVLKPGLLARTGTWIVVPISLVRLTVIFTKRWSADLFCQLMFFGGIFN